MLVLLKKSTPVPEEDCQASSLRIQWKVLNRRQDKEVRAKEMRHSTGHREVLQHVGVKISGMYDVIIY